MGTGRGFYKGSILKGPEYVSRGFGGPANYTIQLRKLAFIQASIKRAYKALIRT